MNPVWQYLRTISWDRWAFFLVLAFVCYLNVKAAVWFITGSEGFGMLSAGMVNYFVGRSVAWYWMKKDGIIP